MPGSLPGPAPLPGAAVCAGLSVRWLTQALRAHAVAVQAIDCFGDSDTRAAASNWAPLGCAEAAVDAGLARQLAQELPAGLPLWYGSGFEARPEALAALTFERILVGNPPALLAQVSTPAEWLRALADCGLSAPETLLHPTPAALPVTGRWLLKRAGTSGGSGVSHWQPGSSLPAGSYLQRFEPGHSLGLTFLADGNAARLLGVVRHIRLQHLPSLRFAQAAMVGLNSLPTRLHESLETGLAALVRHWGLRGVNGADVILRRDGALRWLELNARLPGSLALAGPAHPWVLWHWQTAGPEQRALAQLRPGLPVCADPPGPCVPMLLPLPAPLGPGGATAACAAAIVRAQSILRAPASLPWASESPWPAWVHDLPEPGTLLRAMDPVITISSEGSSAREAILTLRRRMNILAARLGFPHGRSPAR